MRLRIFVEPQQGASYETLRAAAQGAEDAGFDAFFRSDHYLKMGDTDGLPGPTDAWTTLAGLARDTTSIRLGTLVTSATFRLPGPLAITVAQVDEMSGGRVELGLGAGWYEAEHAAYAIPFPSLAERFERLEEQLSAIVGLWTTPAGETFSARGRHYTFTDSPALPKPVQRPHPPIVIGGGGKRRTPRLAATYAQEYNAPFLQPDEARAAYGRADEACATIGRDPASLRRSAAVTVCCGTDDAQVARRADRMGWKLEDLKRAGACGTPEEVVERLGHWRDAGAQVAYLQLLDPSDLDHIELLGSAVAPKL
ncbi:MAG TPA: LLM class F420-dependent oxidoreductase [Acidimicrobiales bacterium]|jgi:F420-dependent oxidoreductase-like protein|nr:LLM class F420-dependent oxidoreductase [Acidimicrobiales bacterium]